MSGSIAFISRSQSRITVLASLSEAPKRLREVVADVDIPRTTVRDNLKQLVQYGIVREDTDRRYRLTTTGRLIFDAYRKCERETAVVERLEPFLAHVPNDALPETVALFGDATLVTRTRRDPYRVISALTDLVSDKQHVRALMPTVAAPVVDAILGSPGDVPQTVQVLTGETDDESLGDRAASDSDSDVTVRQSDQPLPFGLVVDEEQVTVYCLDDEMVMRALIHVDDADACRWGAYTFERYWSGGDLHPPYTDRMSY